MKKSLKLVHSVEKPQEKDSTTVREAGKRLYYLAALSFFVIKFPALFASVQGSELRELDALIRAAQGGIPYHDFPWFSGPLTSMIYGILLKIFPATVLSLRIIAHLFWTVTALYCARILGRYFQSAAPIFCGTLLAVGAMGYSTQSFAVPLFGCFLLFTAFHLVRFADDQGPKDLLLSNTGATFFFYSAPPFAAYGVYLGWMALFLLNNTIRPRCPLFILFAINLFFQCGILYLWCRQGMSQVFAPAIWSIHAPESYPSIVRALMAPRETGGWIEAARIFRGVWESLVFLVFAIAWPACIFTMVATHKFDKRIRAAAICTALALVGFGELFFAGSPDPISNPKLINLTGASFSLSCLGFVLFFWSFMIPMKKRKSAYAFLVFFLAFSAWAYLPLGRGVYELTRFHRNPYGFGPTRGLAFDPRWKGLAEAVQFVNARCGATDAVLSDDSSGVARGLLNCPNIFPAELAELGIFDRRKRELSQEHTVLSPRFFLKTDLETGNSSAFCNEKDWKVKDFTSEATGKTVRVCWKD